MTGHTAVSPLTVARLAGSAARGTPGVAELDGGALGEIATYWEGDKVRGVRVQLGDRPHVALRVVAVWGCPLPELAERVRRRVVAALQEHMPDLHAAVVDVHISDVTGPNQQKSSSR